MTKKRKCIIAVSVLLLVVFVAGISIAVATSSLGSQSDPLVTVSYLNQTVKSDIENQVDSAIAAAEAELSTKLDAQLDSLDDGANAFELVVLSNGQTLTCSAGTELMLRIGTASSTGADSPRLIDTTDGTSISSSGTSLTTNHLYMVTIAGNGVKATADTTKLLVRGTYTIS